VGKDTVAAVRIELLSSSLRRFLDIIPAFTTGSHTGCFREVSAIKNHKINTSASSYSYFEETGDFAPSRLYTASIEIYLTNKNYTEYILYSFPPQTKAVTLSDWT
jgi:hypothetical protein